MNKARRHGFLAPATSIDAFLSISLFAAALILRWPHLMLLPAFSDEGLEVLWGLDIALGKRLPFTGYDAYDGPLFAYLMAAGFKFFGVGLAVPRVIVAVGAALTVPATFWFGRLAEGRWTGILAASMVGTCPALILYSGHYAWSNSLTPLLATLSFACLYIGVERANLAAVLSGAFLAGLTVQTHPIAAVGFAGAALWIMQSGRRASWPTRKDLASAAACFAAGYAPMILANILRPAVALRVARVRTYAFAPTVNPIDYGARLIDLSRTFLDMLAGGFAFERVPAPWPAVVVAATALCGVLVLDWLRGNRFLSFVMLSTALLTPLFVKLFIPRYVTFLIPLTFVAAAAAIHRSMRIVTHATATGGWARRPGARDVVLASIVVAVAAGHLTLMRRYTAWAFSRGLSNEGYYRLHDQLTDSHACGRRLFIEEVGSPLSNSAWVGLYAVDYVLTLTGCEHNVMTVENVSQAVAEQGDAWAVLSNPARDRWSRQWNAEATFRFGAPAGPDLIPLALYHITTATPSP